MCPAHWTALAATAVPTSLGLIGYLTIRLKRNDARPPAPEKEK